ncbi:hypothetical protein ACTFIZ_001698 [Dictyostelium cf. discoideum]
MNKILSILLLSILILFILRVESYPTYGGSNSANIRREDRHSFRAPFLQSGTGILYWDIEGSTIVNDDFIRLTSDQKSLHGAIWNTEPMEQPWWEVVFEFRVHGAGRIGADGIALWLVDRKEGNSQDFSIYGSKNLWKGLAIIFDTFDNDQNGDHPLISVFYNDGTKFYETAKDGSNMKLGSCSSRYRNDKHNAKSRIRYYHGLLSVEIDPNGSGIFEKCVQDVRLDIPTRYTFGVSAATGGLTDNHDVYSFDTFSLDASVSNQNTNNYNNVQFERERLEKQRLEYETQQQQQQQQQQTQQQQQQTQQQTQQQNNQDKEYQEFLQYKAQQQQQNNYQQTQNDLLEKLNEIQQEQQQQQQQQQTQPPQQQQTQPPQQKLQDEIKNLSEKEQIGFLVKKVDSLVEAIHSLHIVLDDPEYKKSFDGLRDQVNVISQALVSLSQGSLKVKDFESFRSTYDQKQSQFIKDFYDFKSTMQDLKATINNRFNNQDNDVTKSIESVNMNLNSLRKLVEASTRDTQKISSILNSNADELANTIQKHSSFGFWTYFLFVQAIFIFGFVFWRKYKDDNNKKLI